MGSITPGIRAKCIGQRIVDKVHRGVRIYARLGFASHAQAEAYLALEIERVDEELDRKANARLRFVDGAARYLKESENKRSVDISAWHVRLLTPYIGTLELNRIHDGSLKPFVAEVCSSVPKSTQQSRAKVAHGLFVHGHPRGATLGRQTPPRRGPRKRLAYATLVEPRGFDEFATAAVLGSAEFDGSDGWSRVTAPAESISRSLSHVHHERRPKTHEAGAARAAHARIDDAERSAIQQPLGERL
jgi:hypothetical protein